MSLRDFLEPWEYEAMCGISTSHLFFPRDEDVFFPDGSEASPSFRHKEDRAVALCSVCPVWRECITRCVQEPDSWGYGVWGGLTQADRKKLPRDLASALAAAEAKRGTNPVQMVMEA